MFIYKIMKINIHISFHKSYTLRINLENKFNKALKIISY